MNKKVICRIYGGLGNQLFMYAAARRLSLVSEAELVIDDVSGFIRDHRYKRQYELHNFNITSRRASSTERMEPLSRIRRYISKIWNSLLPFGSRSYIYQEYVDFDARLLSFRPRGAITIDGYWQGEGYFNSIENEIRSDLKITPPNDMPNERMASLIRSTNAVAVHVRFFDAPISNSTAGDNNASSEYYGAAIKYIENKVNLPHYFIFSDQIDEARKLIDLPNDRVTLVGHNQNDRLAYADLWLMTQCNHFIIANSTFSWWGAWLSTNKEKIVIAPGFVKKTGESWWGFEGLLPSEWIKM